MRNWIALATVAVFVFAGSVLACEKDAKLTGAKSGCSKSAQLVAAGSVDPAVAEVTKKLPYMTYRVGDFETCCSKTAEEKAGKDGKIQYVVAHETFDCRAKATARLAALLETEVENMVVVRYAVGDECFSCPITAKSKASENGSTVKYRLAGFDFNTRDEADAVAKSVSDAVAKLAASEGQPAAKPGCGKAAAAAASGCSKSKAATASAKSGCSKTGDKAKAQTASGKAGCGKAGAKTASAEKCCSKAEYEACCKAAEARVAAARAKIEAIVQSAAAARTS